LKASRFFSIFFFAATASLFLSAATCAGSGGAPGPAGIGLVTAIGLAVVSAAVLAIAFHALKQPAMLAFILAGLLMQTGFAGSLGESIKVMEQVSHLGLVFLLFIIGIEMDLNGIRRLGKGTATAVLLQAPIACAVIVALQWALSASGLALPGLGDSGDKWFYYGVAAALSSTAVVVKLLSDKFDLTSQAGTISIFTLIAQDIWAVLALSYVMMAGAAGADGGGAAGLLVMLGGGLAVLVAIMFFSRWVLAKLFARMTRSPELVTLVALGWCFLCAEAFSRIGFSAEMGALIAGLAIGRLAIHTEILSKVLSLRDFFMALFFVSLGVSLPPLSIEILTGALALVAIVVIARFILFTPTLLAARQGPIVALAAPINLAQISEFSLLIIPIGAAHGVLTGNDIGVISYAMMLSVILSTYAIKYNYHIAKTMDALLGFQRLGGGAGAGAESAVRGAVGAHGGHGAARDIIMLGFHHTSAEMAALAAASDPDVLRRVLVVDFNVKNHDRIRSMGMEAVYGDISNPDTLRHHGIEKARAVVLSLSDTYLRGTSAARMLATIRMLNPNARLIATSVNAEQSAELSALGAFACVSPAKEAAPAYLQAIKQAME
jgi:Kef-type K+ transport system membrane component KefB